MTTDTVGGIWSYALEAALSSCARVLGDIPTLRELWSGAALFVPPDDHDALLTALANLIRQPAPRAHFGRAARMRGLDDSLARMTAAYLHAYAAERGSVADAGAQPAAAAD
jgi:glycogen synthase